MADGLLWSVPLVMGFPPPRLPHEELTMNRIGSSVWFVLGSIGLMGAAALHPDRFSSTASGAEPATATLARWAQWRGPSGQGYSNDTRVPLTWGDKQNLVWKTDLPGRGNSTPII